ncbi:hypothetical protein P3342_008427 [Pyrenophora teres f. teres]|nr:hypothetical protein P3342_008427 [Pyrenophora teres f. teres]
MNTPHSPSTLNTSPTAVTTPPKNDYTASKPNETDSPHPSKTAKPPKRAKKHHVKVLGPLQDEDVPNPISPLLGLPPELLHRIATYALTSPTHTLTYDFTHMRFDVSSIGVGLMATCHTIALQTRFLHFSSNTLVFKVGNPADAGAVRDLGVVHSSLCRVARAHGRLFWACLVVKGKRHSMAVLGGGG